MNSTFTFDVLIHGLLGVEYSLWLDAPPRSAATCSIERETRDAGGIALLTALELAGRGARVAIYGNAIGDDSNGRVVTRAFEHPNLTCFAPQIVEVETPYWVSLRTNDTNPAILSRWSTVEFDRTPVETINAKVFACDGFWPDKVANWKEFFETRGTPFADVGQGETSAQWADRIWTLLDKRE